MVVYVARELVISELDREGGAVDTLALGNSSCEFCWHPRAIYLLFCQPTEFCLLLAAAS